MTSLVEAIRKKIEKLNEINIFGTFTPKRSNRAGANILLPAHTLSMDGQNIASIGDEKELMQSFSHLEDLDLSGNHLSSWVEVFSLLRCLENLQSLNLSQNPLGINRCKESYHEKLKDNQKESSLQPCEIVEQPNDSELDTNKTIGLKRLSSFENSPPSSSSPDENIPPHSAEIYSPSSEIYSTKEHNTISTISCEDSRMPSEVAIEAQILAPTTRFPNLKVLALNSTYMPWNWVMDVLHRLPNLSELHVALNNYGVDEDYLNGSGDTFETRSTIPVFPKLLSLYYSDNGISSWWTVCRLGRHFPGLEQLVLLGNPIKHIPAPLPSKDSTTRPNRVHMTSAKACDDINEYSTNQGGNDVDAMMNTTTTTTTTNPSNTHANKLVNGTDSNLRHLRPQRLFSNLHTLGLSETMLERWESVDALGEWMPNLKNLRLGASLPLFQSWPEFECRAHVIARLPNLTTYNRSVIDCEERENAEREFVRHFGQVEPEKRPDRYWELERLHGRLEPLANIDLSPKRFVRVRVAMEEKEIWCDLNVGLKVAQVKRQFCNLFGIEPTESKRIKLFYFDQVMSQIQGPEELKFPSRAIHSYQPESGDLFELMRIPDRRR